MMLTSEPRCEKCERPLRTGEPHVLVLRELDNFVTGETARCALYRHQVCPTETQ